MYSIIYFAVVGQIYGGVEQKILSQFDALKSLGAQIELVLVSTAPPDEIFSREIGLRQDIVMLINAPENRKNPMIRRKEKFLLMENHLRKHRPDNLIVYLRYPGADRIFHAFLSNNRTYRFVTEHQQIENTLKLLRTNGGILIGAIDFIWGKKCRRLLTGIVAVTEDISNFQRRYFSADSTIPLLTNGNGIDSEKYPVRNFPGYSPGDPIKILFMGSGFKSHGLKRLILSIAEFTNKHGKDKIAVEIVGDSGEMDENKALVSELSLSDNFHFHGFLQPTEYESLFNSCHMAMGSLGLHRLGLKSASTLKLREYCARGIPFFYSTPDDDFPESFPFQLLLPANDKPFDPGVLTAFVQGIAENPEHPHLMRRYSQENLDYKLKMKRLLEFFHALMTQHHVA